LLSSIKVLGLGIVISCPPQPIMAAGIGRSTPAPSYRIQSARLTREMLTKENMVYNQACQLSEIISSALCATGKMEEYVLRMGNGGMFKEHRWYRIGKHCICTALHCTALHYTALHCTALHCTALHCTALHCTALH
jgi:hypothetical protein